MFGDTESSEIGAFLSVLERMVDAPPKSLAKTHVKSLQHILKRANGFSGANYEAFCEHLAGKTKPRKKPKLTKAQVQPLVDQLIIVEPVNEAFEATVRRLEAAHLAKTLVQLAKLYAPGMKPKTKTDALAVIRSERKDRVALANFERLAYNPHALTLPSELNDAATHSKDMKHLNSRAFAASNYDERRVSHRVPMGTLVRVVSTDLMTARPASLVDLSTTGAKLRWPAKDEIAPRSFYVLMFGTKLGRVRTLCEKRWQVGSAVGVRFVSALSENEFSDVIHLNEER